MKVEREKRKVFEPIIITLETEKETKYMNTIACTKVIETLRECCRRNKQEVSDVDKFGASLTVKLDGLLDC